MGSRLAIVAVTIVVLVCALLAVVFVLRPQPPVDIPMPDTPVALEQEPALPGPMSSRGGEEVPPADVPQLRSLPVPNFPASRVRDVQQVEHTDLAPLLTNNRILFRNVGVSQVENGMQVTGSIWTDFECVPDDPAYRHMAGQLRVTINVWLSRYHYSYNPAQPMAEPSGVAGSEARLVSGQAISVKASTFEHGFGAQSFALPVLPKPLAPGVYRLTATVGFLSQALDVREALRWCADWYGWEELDPSSAVSQPVRVLDVPAQHDRYYRELLETIGHVESTATLYVGDVYHHGDEVNVAVWTPWMQRCQEIAACEDELHAAAVQDLERLGPAPDVARITQVAGGFVERAGGPIEAADRAVLQAATAAKDRIKLAIHEFHGALAYQYWVLTSGHIEYGYHTLNVPGYNAWEAVNSDDLTKDKRERIAKYGEVDRREWEQKLRDDWKRVPKDITDIAAQYLKRRMFSADFDAEKFCEKGSGTEILLDIGKWAAFRAEFRQKFLEETNKVLEKVTTTNRYANQVWPLVLAQATTARDSVITVGYAWEYYIRRNGMEHDAQSIRDGWQAEAARETNLRLETYYQRAQGSPGTVDTAIKGYVEYVKRNTGVPALATAYSAAIQAGAATRDLPGRGE